MMYRAAYFISPAGEIIQVPKSHIAYVIENPDLFGWTYEKIHQVYAKYKEPIGLEGKARHEILIDAIRRGWIRIRRYKEYWRITLNSLENNKRHLDKWADHISNASNTPLRIFEMATNTEYKLQLKEFFRFGDFDQYL